tara:strand:+ start:2774 stop:3265 length:492 start_codon:yes stop_codon:yes gene_type:complete
MDQAEFVECFGIIFEHSSWIVSEAWHAGLTAHDDYADGLFSSFVDIVEDVGYEAKLLLLRAHPDLAGRLAQQGETTDFSISEQHSAGLDYCSQEEIREFYHLNQRYTDKFGFPFILAVQGLERVEILKIFRKRVENEMENEFDEAIRQVFKIARLRLSQIKLA